MVISINKSITSFTQHFTYLMEFVTCTKILKNMVKLTGKRLHVNTEQAGGQKNRFRNIQLGHFVRFMEGRSQKVDTSPSLFGTLSSRSYTLMEVDQTYQKMITVISTTINSGKIVICSQNFIPFIKHRDDPDFGRNPTQPGHGFINEISSSKKQILRTVIREQCNQCQVLLCAKWI